VHTVSLNSIQIKPLYKWWSIFCKTRCRRKQHCVNNNNCSSKTTKWQNWIDWFS